MKRIAFVGFIGTLTLPLTLASIALANGDPVQARKRADAAVDRNILLPSAETIEAGELAFNSYELVFAGLTYGLTDNLQISATGLLPLTADMPRIGAASAKLALMRTGRMVLSIQPNVIAASNDGVTGGILGMQVLLDWLVDDAGNVALTLGQGTHFAWGGSTGEDTEILDDPGITLSAAITARAHRIVKLMAEVVLPAAYIDGTFHVADEALLLNYGVRFFGDTLAADLTFLRPLHPDADNEFILGVPFVSFSARF